MGVRAAGSAPPRRSPRLTRGLTRPTAFASVDGKQVSLLQYKLLYVVMASVLLAAGLYKCNSMGLLPVSSADWIGMIDAFRVRSHPAAWPSCASALTPCLPVAAEGAARRALRGSCGALMCGREGAGPHYYWPARVASGWGPPPAQDRVPACACAGG